MPNRIESLEERQPLKFGLSEPAKSRVRIGRACDRCKIKKSKCDGNTPCSACIASESTCEYSARRRREARDWYLGMQDIIDEAIQRLYWACRNGRGFPGVVPDEDSGRVSTDAILRGLGLSPPPVDNARPSGSGSDSVLDTQAQLFVPRSYHPPDVPRQARGLSRGMTTSSAMTPMSTTSDDIRKFGDERSETGRRGQRSSPMELDEEEDDVPSALPDGLDENLPDGLGQELRDGIDANIDPAMTQGDSGGYANGSMYSDMSVGGIGFGGLVRLGAHAQQMPMQPLSQFRVPSLSQQRLQSVTQSLGTTEQQAWQGRHDDTADGTIPWPGSLTSKSRKEKANARGGFDAAEDRKR